MSTERVSIHGQWSSRMAFILAATGSAVGLGNIWKFPYITGENGGGAFVLVYLLCVLIIGIPIMIAEITLGRRGRQSPMNTMYTLAIESGHSPLWKLLGFMGVFAGFIILSYYSVIAGWAIYYMFLAGGSEFTGITAAGVNSKFLTFTQDPVYLLFFHTLFMLITMYVVSQGVRSGLEKATKLLMPALFVILLILDGYALNTKNVDQGISFLFYPDFAKLSWAAVLTAMGHAFFTLSLGMGAIMVYGSYLPRHTSIAQASMIIAIADTVVALLAGVAIFPVVFSHGLEAGSGPGLLFITLPLAFGQMEWGSVFGTLFFLLVIFAAWTSSISLLEPAVTWLVENHGFKRIKATFVAGVAIWVMGIFTVFSFNKWAFKFSFLGQTYENGFFNIFDILTANVMLPLGGMLIALFAGWFMSREATRDELDMQDWAYRSWRFLVRYISPFAILIVFLNVIGVLKL